MGAAVNARVHPSNGRGVMIVRASRVRIVVQQRMVSLRLWFPRNRPLLHLPRKLRVAKPSAVAVAVVAGVVIRVWRRLPKPPSTSPRQRAAIAHRDRSWRSRLRASSLHRRNSVSSVASRACSPGAESPHASSRIRGGAPRAPAHNGGASRILAAIQSGSGMGNA
jgi:hypothetical protein